METRALELSIYRIEQLERQVREQADELKTIEDRLAARELERTAAERKQLLAGIIFLGGVITTLGGVIWSYRDIIFRGSTP